MHSTLEEEDFVQPILTHESNEASVIEKVQDWSQKLGEQESFNNDLPNIDDIPEASESYDAKLYEDESEQGLPDPNAYQDLVSPSAAFRWLLATMRREVELDFSVSSSLSNIKTDIVSLLPMQGKMSRKKQLEPCRITFLIEWDPFDFFRQQAYRESPAEALNAAITITGTLHDAEALTCSQYLLRTWPTTGQCVLSVLSELVMSSSRSTREC